MAEAPSDPSPSATALSAAQQHGFSRDVLAKILSYGALIELALAGGVSRTWNAAAQLLSLGELTLVDASETQLRALLAKPRVWTLRITSVVHSTDADGFAL